MKMLQKVVKSVEKNARNAECKNTVISVRVALFMIGILLNAETVPRIAKSVETQKHVQSASIHFYSILKIIASRVAQISSTIASNRFV